MNNHHHDRTSHPMTNISLKYLGWVRNQALRGGSITLRDSAQTTG